MHSSSCLTSLYSANSRAMLKFWYVNCTSSFPSLPPPPLPVLIIIILQTQLEEFHKSWYFGMDNTDEWLDNIEAETENMFSIDVNQQGVYSAHFLSLRKQTIAVTPSPPSSSSPFSLFSLFLIVIRYLN